MSPLETIGFHRQVIVPRGQKREREAAIIVCMGFECGALVWESVSKAPLMPPP